MEYVTGAGMVETMGLGAGGVAGGTGSAVDVVDDGTVVVAERGAGSVVVVVEGVGAGASACGSGAATWRAVACVSGPAGRGDPWKAVTIPMRHSTTTRVTPTVVDL